ncbi:Uncharacterised protein [Yersinia bercovieri]|nr:Uncharacterised protein [Yersinia bercovieri]CNE76663.1 Uncharacterised protein [Yersinia bercovieri]CNI27242.1 Uncharacterised protein [Yersinia bercovieri]
MIVNMFSLISDQKIIHILQQIFIPKVIGIVGRAANEHPPISSFRLTEPGESTSLTPAVSR